MDSPFTPEFDETTFNPDMLTLPGHLDETSPLAFESKYMPFSPTSPGKKSPGRPKTMREYEEDINNLKRENFNLKVRIYFIEQSRIDQNVPKDYDELRHAFTELKFNYEKQSKDLDNKEDLLLNTYRALEAQRMQLESMKTEHDSEKQELQDKVDALEIKVEELEKDVRDYQVRFMESSLHLDDTQNLYAVTFGLKQQKPSDSEELKNKIAELESLLSQEREAVSRMEKEVVEVNQRSEKEREQMKELHQQVTELEERLAEAVKEKESHQEAIYNVTKLAKDAKRYKDALRIKETEADGLKSKLVDFERRLSSLKCRLKENESESEQSHVLQKQVRMLMTDNAELKKQLSYLQHHTSPRSSHSRRGSEEERKVDSEAQLQVLKLQKKIIELTSRPASDNPSVQSLVQSLLKENKQLKKVIGELKSENITLRFKIENSSKEEVESNIDAIIKQMTTEKDLIISELNQKIEELSSTVNEQLLKLQEYQNKLQKFEDLSELKSFTEQKDSEKDALLKELEEQKKEVDSLKKELKKKTYNLQGLVNTELWDKNREIEKLNKVCERKHLEVMALQKQLREFPLTFTPEKITFKSPRSMQSNNLAEDKENVQPPGDYQSLILQITEEKRLLVRKIEELEARLLNTPERDTESSLVQTLRMERDNAEKLRKEAVNACVLLTTRLQELADFLDSLLPTLCGRKRRVVQRAVERSRELSRSLSMAAEESSMQNMSCSVWTDLQPSLYIPLLPDISTVDFWSGDETPPDQEVLSATEPQKVITSPAQQPSFLSDKNTSGVFSQAVFSFDESLLPIESRVFNNSLTKDVAEGSLLETSDVAEKAVKLNAEVKSANIGAITLTSRKKEAGSVMEKSKIKDGGVSEAEEETWSEPDRDVSFARMGLTETHNGINKTLPSFPCDDTSETADSPPIPHSPRKSSEIQRLQRKIRSLEQINEALRSELQILHKLTPPAHSLSRQDKATSVEASRQSSICVPAHLFEEIQNQREKLEASLFHNDYIRRQLESTMYSLRKSQTEEQEMSSLVKLTEVTGQLHLAQCELTKLKLEKEGWTEKVEHLEATLRQNASEVIEKQCALLELENNKKQLEADSAHRLAQLEHKCQELEKQRDSLQTRIAENDREISKLSAEVSSSEQEGKKNKQVCEELNVKIQQITHQKDELQRVVSDQEQLLADAERERQELATQLIARDRQVSELQQRLSQLEQTSGELDAALRSQCHQFETQLQDLENTNKQIAQVERIKSELERRVAELEAVNAELESRLASLQVDTKPYSDCDTEAELAIGSPRRLPPPLSLPLHAAQRHQDLTSDYLSDQDHALSSPQVQPHNIWFPSSPHSHTHSQASASPDLGIDSDHGRFSSLETHTALSTSTRGGAGKDMMKLEEENSQLRRNLQKTRHALEETLSQLTAANQHKRQYEAQLSAANQHKAKVERAICHQLNKTHSILKKAKRNLTENNTEQL